MPEVVLSPTSSMIGIGSSVSLTCAPSVSNVNLYDGANVNFQYQLNGGSIFHNMNKVISEGTIPTDMLEVIMNTTAAGAYVCAVTINGESVSTIAGSSASGEGTTQITAQSKHSLLQTSKLHVHVWELRIAFEDDQRLSTDKEIWINFVYLPIFQW